MTTIATITVKAGFVPTAQVLDTMKTLLRLALPGDKIVVFINSDKLLIKVTLTQQAGSGISEEFDAELHSVPKLPPSQANLL